MISRGRFLSRGLFFVLAVLCLTAPAAVHAAMNDYCITPPFVVAGVKPNLVMMIDNSASQFDLQYQDTSHTYCANDPTASCTPGTTCGGTAYCLQSYTTTTATTYSATSCTANGQCPNSPTTYKAKTCTRNLDCTASGSKCSAGLCTKCNISTGVGDCVVDKTPCYLGFCNYCDTVTGTGDCSSTTNTTFSPIPCSLDSTCSAITTGDTCNNRCNATRQCYDSTYSSATTYYGYFDSAATYTYDLTNNKFTSGATMPLSCAYSAGSPVYVCVNTTGSPETLSDPDGFVANGNFLNWLTTSKFDVQKKILTGGKFDATDSVLLADSRGCAGRKFIKAIPGVNLTFAVRGGTATGISGTHSLATEYGQTYIEIHTGTYNTADCLNAMYDWIHYDSVNLGSFQNDTKGCVGAGYGQYNAINIWNHILHDCYNGLNDKAQGYSTNLNALEIECQKAYAAGVTPDSITDPNSGIAVCSSVLSYLDSGGNPQVGYLGRCWNGASFTSPCDVTQMENFCVVNTGTDPVVDPTSTVLPTSGGSVPGFIMEQGLMDTPLVGTLTVAVGQASAPTGLIDKYKNLIRFGAMTFNYNGSYSESGTGKLIPFKTCSDNPARICFVSSDCVSGTCSTTADKDGGKIISYIGLGKCSSSANSCTFDSDCTSGETCNLWVGDHTSGLIQQVDSIIASTWTPFSEAAYNVIGYYTQNSSMRLNSTAPMDFETHAENSANPNPIQYKCQKNNVLLITDGMSTADQNSSVLSFVSTNHTTSSYTSTASASILTVPTYFGSVNVDQLAWYGCQYDTSQGSCTSALTNSSVSWSDHVIKPITTHVVYSGAPCLYKDTYGDCCSTSSIVSGRCAAYADESIVSERLMQLTAKNGGGSYTLAQNPEQLYTALDNTFQQIAGKAASGTAASVLASGEGSGANLVQAIFYPERQFGTTKINWTGSMKNLWYYIDPHFGGSSIREDTPPQDKTLNLIDDHVIRFFFDTSDNTTKARVYSDDNGDGIADAEVVGSPVYFESVNSLWEAGKKLFDTPVASRNIYTSLDGTSRFLFDPGNASNTTLQTLLQAASQNEATAIIRYTKGEDTPFSPAISGFSPTYRNRTVTIGGTTGTWKLGDVVNSTPRILSWVPANTYNKTYNDRTYEAFTDTADYKARGTVFVGANDGMLHAFKLGLLKLYEERYKKAELTGTDLGVEQWAYIPKNVLPYLKYLADPNYCHLYSIDATPVILDASIGSCASGDYWDCTKSSSTWRTVIIGGMRFGGACKNSTTACTRDMNGDGVVNSADCVHTPIADNGYSSYFALDITDPTDPQVLWELSSETMGFSTSGPAIVRIAAKKADGVTPDNDKNGRWFAVFGSGPTGPIDAGTHQFKGFSDQPLKLFIVDLKNGPTSGNYWQVTTNLTYAFAGSMANGAIDFDQDNSANPGFYQDDAVYLGYTRSETIPPVATSKWNVGGVLRLFTRNSLYPDGNGDSTKAWAYSSVISGVGPVTSAVAKIQNYTTHKVWLYFGTGRYFYKSGDNIDDGSSGRSLYGVSEPCFTASGVNFDCTTSRARINLGNASSSASSDTDGWYIDLDGCTNSSGTAVLCTDATAAFKAERSVTDPLATGIGVVFFTTTKPSADICEFGGGSHLWAVKYDTGWTPSSSVLRGRAILQVSTGSIEEINLKDALTQKDGRRTDLIQGVPSGSLPGFQVSPKPMNKILHIREE